MKEQHSIKSALAALEAAPLSRKAAMLLALLIDREIDRRFAASGEGDVLVYRARMAAADALALVLELVALREGGARLVLEPVAVPVADYPKLSEADYMVSLYNGATVPRVLIAVGTERHDAVMVLREAVAALN
jgi:hypothetical protein